MAVVVLSTDFTVHTAGTQPLLSHLTGDLAAAREGYERARTELSRASATFDEADGEYDDDFVRTTYGQLAEGAVVATPFETATWYLESSKPAVVDVGYGVFAEEWDLVHSALEHLRTWSEERHERARRLVLVLHEFVKHHHDADTTRNLAALRNKLDLPKPS
ncbi:hypothetical protein ABT324_17250 [Saccharopolyspora sp. NPDC000359]|uniref:hypothetical protein n=1 Tax=Saccharopolyspora sp. NPDC000359 TaxID=3154251 RepID=UPI003328F091